MHLSKLFSSADPFSSQLYQINLYTNTKQTTYTDKHQMFSDSPFESACVKKSVKRKAMLVSMTIPSDLSTPN